MSLNCVKQVSVSEFAEVIEGTVEKSRLDLGGALVLRCSGSVIGDVIAISTSDGKYAIISV